MDHLLPKCPPRSAPLPFFLLFPTTVDQTLPKDLPKRQGEPHQDGQHMAGFNNSDGPASPAAPTPPAGAPCASTEDGITPVTDHPAAAPGVSTPHTQTAQNTSLPGVLEEPVRHQTEEDRLRAALNHLRGEAAAARSAAARGQAQNKSGRGTRGVSWIDAERNVLAAVYKEATLNAVVGVDQTIDTFDDDVADRFRRRLPDHMPQVGRRRARSTPAIMKELRYGIFPAVHRFKDCYLAVLKLKMTVHPSPEQLINAAKAKYNGLNPYDGLNPAVAAKLSCPPLSNWRILKELDKFSGGATIAALGVTAPAQGVSAADHADADPLTLSGGAEAEDRDEGDGQSPLSSTFARGKSMFQDRPVGNKAAKAALRADLHLHREAASNAAALESLAKSAVQRNTLAFWSRPEVANSADGRKWWAIEMRKRLKTAEDNESDDMTNGVGDSSWRDDINVDVSAATASGGRHGGDGSRRLGDGRRRVGDGGRRRARALMEEDDDGPAVSGRARGQGPGGGGASRRGGGALRGVGRHVQGRHHSRGRATTRGGGRCQRVRTVRNAGVSSSSLSSATSRPPPPSTPYDDEDNEEVYFMGDDYYHVEPPPQTAPVTTPTTPASGASAINPPAPSTPIEAAAEEAAAMIAAAAARTDSDVSCGALSDDADKDEEEPDQPRAGGRSSRGRATNSAAAQWAAGASAQGGSDVHLDSDTATDALLDGDYQSGRNRRGRVATTAARPPLPPRLLGTGWRARSAASLAYAEVTCSSSSSSSSEDERGCDDQEDLCTAAAPHRGRAVQNGRLRSGRL